MRNSTAAAFAAAVSIPASLVFSSPALAAGDDEIARIREQLQEMKTVYEARIASLEERLERAEKRTENRPSAVRPASAPGREAPREATPVRTPVRADADFVAAAPPVYASAAPRQASPSAFNPEMSLILSGSYARMSKDPEQRRLQGFMPSGGERLPETRSFNLGETELALSANIDPFFRGEFRMAVAPDNTIGVEEANIQTLGLGHGFNVKAGRFLSGVGYLNEHHPHAWDFSDAPLPYQAFFGNALGMDGVQVRWLAPTDLFLEFGVEAARSRSFPTTDETRGKNGGLSGSAFARLGGDVGTSNSWRAGLSYFAARPRDRVYEDPLNATSSSFSGRSRTWIADFIWKWAPNGNARYRNLKIQGEYFSRPEKGDLTYDPDGAALVGDYKNRASGFYAQTVYQFLPRWRAGYRYDELRAGGASIGLVKSGALTIDDLPLLKSYRPKRHTVMLDFSPTEFSRVRVQFARDRTRPEAVDNQLWIQYIMSMGAHGAHKF
ncbi:MAG: hypothetical protein LBM17_00175 [Candidatus Accumulibacter sp.]|jgi:hypothetical protein|nr:hypothetical protein [Accumulibacter sp.]